MASSPTSWTAPIDVDHDSDATLSSHSDVDMDGPERVTSMPPTNAPEPLPPTATSTQSSFSDSMAVARENLLTAASLGNSPSVSHVIPSMSTAIGKKRRLSSPPPGRELSKVGKSRASLDFRLAPTVKRVDRSMQFIEDDEDVEEETKSDPGEKRSVTNGDWHRSASSMIGAMNRVESMRTWVCGRWFGKCRLEFHAVYVSISLYSLPTAEGTIECEFRGSIQSRQLERFSLSRGPAPYFAILELSRRADFEPAFSQFYDAIFARVTEQEGPSVVPDIYGLLLFFDDDLELARCQSLGDVSKTLRILLERSIPTDEALQVKALKFELQSSTSTLRSNRSPLKLRQSKIQIDAKATDKDSSTLSTQFRTSSRRKSLLQQSARDAEVVVQLSGETDTEPNGTGASDNGSDRRSTRGVMKLMQQHHKSETQRLAAERKAKLLLSYPFDEQSRAGQISITYGDIDRLKPGEFLNDSIIDFYLRYLWRHVEPWQQQRVYFFSSHFFTQLCGGKISGGISLTEDRLRRIARWSQKENLFEKRFIFVPINDSFHWSIAVLCNPGSAIIQKRQRPSSRKTKSNHDDNVILIDSTEEAVIVDTTEDASDSEEEELFQKDRLQNPPCLLFLDSLRCHQKKKICTLLKTYIEYEFKSRFNNQQGDTAGTTEHNDVTTFDLDAITIIEPEIPLQSNSSDCGVFLLMYTAQILQRFPGGLCREDVTSKLSSSMSKQMFDDGHVQEFRDYLHQLIFMLQKIERRGGNEMAIKTEGLEFFAVED